MAAEHVSVLARESIDALVMRSDGVYVDATYGAGGHTRLMLAQLGPSGRIVAFDADPQAQTRLIADPRLTLVHANFAALSTELDRLSIPTIDGILFDLGVSSMQFDEGDRGFSFRDDAQLDMRMDTTQGETAADVIADRDEVDLANLIYTYGEERGSRRIARALKARLPKTTGELAAIVSSVLHIRGRRERVHPATKTFQALRIAVNDELRSLEAGLEAAIVRTRPGGRIAVISFHSLEDRIVKQKFRDDERVHAVTRKPLVPSEDEIAANPRSRSAKLRVATVIDHEEAA